MVTRLGRNNPLWLVCAVLLLSPAGASADNTALARQAHTLLEKHCGRCHGPDSSARGGMDYVLDSARLVARGQIVRGAAQRSKLYRRVRNGSMPPPRTKDRLTAADITLLRRWIDAGAPAVETIAHRPFIAEETVLRLLRADLATVEPRHRRFIRYLSLVPLANAGVSERRLAITRQAVAKLLNSLSWHPRISVPRAVDPAGRLLRVDLRDYQWTAALWNRVQDAYPYAALEGSAYAWLRQATRCDVPVIRADWFITTASQPPLYYDLLEIPDTDRALERLLRVDVRRDLDEDRVARAGFNGSGVSRNNRLIERHDAAYGAYWHSYDFSDNTGRQNLFEHPLGPQTGHDGFEQAGGEIIFHLPNGLQGYALVDGAGRRIDRASVEIVSDPDRPDHTVEAGLSCMNCHTRGMIRKADQVRAHVASNRAAFSAEDAAIVRAQYVKPTELDALFERDSRRYLKALAQTGAPAEAVDPVSAVARIYEAPLDLNTVAAELAMPPADFRTRLQRTSSLSRVLGPLLTEGGTIQRDAFVDALPQILREFRLPDAVAPTTTTVAQPQPFTGHEGQVLCVAFSPDGKHILSGGEDNTLRLWDAATGRLLRTLRAHEQSVLAVAFTPDGKRALSGSTDRTVRLWDLASGRQLCCLRGHTERISAVVCAPDGQHALSASWDGTIGYWDLTHARLLRRLAGHDGYVSSVAFAPDGRHAISGGYDGTVRWWDLGTGRLIRQFEGAEKEIFCVAISLDGRAVAAGGNDHIVYIWDTARGRLRQRLQGHETAVVRVAFRPDGRSLISGASQYRPAPGSVRVWDLATGKELHRAGPRDATLWSVAFSTDGRRAVVATGNKALRVWNVP